MTGICSLKLEVLSDVPRRLSGGRSGDLEEVRWQVLSGLSFEG